MRHLTLSFLNGFHVALDDRTINHFGSDKARALLAYLALENERPHRRSALAAMFWPDLSEKKAAHNLSQTLLRLRAALEDHQPSEQPASSAFLLIDSQQVQLNPYSRIYTDVVTFRKLLKSCEQHHRKDKSAAANCPDCIGWMRDAAELYGGDFLAGFFVRDSPPLEQWRLVQQEALQMQALSVFEQLCNHFEKRGEYDLVQQYAHRLTILDPWCEDAHLQLMRAMAARGQISAALEHFDRYRRALADELGIEPSQAAANLYQHIRLGEIQPARPEASAVPELNPAAQPEIRQITTLLCSRSLRASNADPEAQYHQMKECRRECARVISRYGGSYAQRLGNECMVYFGYPLAYEDSARRAVFAALEMVANNPTDPVQVSVHTGCMVLGEKRGRRALDRELVGDAPNLARWMLHLTPLGSVTVSPETQSLVQEWFDMRPDQTNLPGGHYHGDPLYRVTGECPQPDPFEWLGQNGRLSQLIGREAEIQQIAGCLEKVTALGSGKMVLLRGEPGIGKSRLIWEMKQRTRRAPDAAQKPPLWLTAHCTQYDQNRSLFPVVRLAERLLGIEPGDCEVTRARKIVEGLERAFPDKPAPVRLMVALMHIPYNPSAAQPTMQVRELMQTAFMRLLQLYAAVQPLVIVIEDLQWSDTDTIAWLGRAPELLENTACLVVLTARSIFDPPWLAHQDITRLDLEPLMPTEAWLLAAAAAAPETTQLQIENIVARCDGNPLYLEELARPVANPHEHDSPCLPPRLRDLLASRLDYLGPAKITCQWAAVIGHRFSYAVLQPASGISPVRLQHDLETMIAAGIIQPLDQPGSDTYMFRHALVREAAAASLLKSTRAEYEKRIAQVLQPA